MDRGKGREGGWVDHNKVIGVGDGHEMAEQQLKGVNFSGERGKRRGGFQGNRNEDKLRGRGSFRENRGRGRRGGYESTGNRVWRGGDTVEPGDEFPASDLSEFSLYFKEIDSNDQRGRTDGSKRRAKGRQRGRVSLREMKKI